MSLSRNAFALAMALFLRTSAWNITLALLFCTLSGQGSSFFVSADDAAVEEIIETADPEDYSAKGGSKTGGDHTLNLYVLFFCFLAVSVYRLTSAREPTEMERRVEAVKAAKAAIDARKALEAVTGAPSTANALHILVNNQSECLKLKEELASKKEEDALAKFQELAKQHSICPSKDQGGSLGTFSKGVMDPAFEKAVFAEAEVGKVHGPVKSAFGYHLVYVVERSGTHTD